MNGIFADLRTRLDGRTGVLVDSNVLLDIVGRDPVWFAWSTAALAEVAGFASLVINPMVYAEVSVTFPTIEDLDAALPVSVYRREALPWEAAFLAGKCFQRYRRLGGVRRSPLPDFFIGAHAAVNRLALLTRDSARYRTYFPAVALLAPARA